jgi:hypothetical protein
MGIPDISEIIDLCSAIGGLCNVVVALASWAKARAARKRRPPQASNDRDVTYRERHSRATVPNVRKAKPSHTIAPVELAAGPDR